MNEHNDIKMRSGEVKRLSLALALLILLVLLFALNTNNKEHTHNLQWAALDPEETCEFRDLHEFISAVEEDTKCLGVEATRIFDLNIKKSQVVIPVPFKDKVLNWLHYDKDLYAKIETQRVIHVYNKLTRTTTAYNPLRASRPLSKADQDPKVYVEKFLNDTREACDFCHYNQMTATDPFGRFESRLAATAVNVFKFNDYHGLAFPKRHDVLDLSLEELTEVVSLAQSWFSRVHEESNSHTTPHLTLDLLPHAGASQAHPHFQLLMGKEKYLGQFRALEEALKNYSKPSNFFSDYVNIHLNLGLAVKVGAAFILSPLDAHKDHEFMILSPKPDGDWIKAFHLIYRTFLEEFNQVCLSSGHAWPSLATDSALSSFPAISKIGSRGNCQAMISDVSSLELYMMYNVNTNPFKSITALKSVIAKSNDKEML